MIDLKMLEAKDWWKIKRRKYNIGLVIAGALAFISYVIVGETLILPYDDEFEITLLTTFFQGVGYLLMIGIANLFYEFGLLFDKKFNKSNSEVFRKRLFNLGFYFSISLPFLIPIILVIQFFVIYYK